MDLQGWGKGVPTYYWWSRVKEQITINCTHRVTHRDTPAGLWHCRHRKRCKKNEGPNEMVKRNERTTTIKIGIVFVKPAKGHNNNEDDDNKQTCLCTESVAHSRTEITAYNSYKYVVAFRTHSNSPSDRSPFNRAAPYQCAVSVRIWMCFLLLLLSLFLIFLLFSHFFWFLLWPISPWCYFRLFVFTLPAVVVVVAASYFDFVDIAHAHKHWDWKKN